jgi:hypothetical protein
VLLTRRKTLKSRKESSHETNHAQVIMEFKKKMEKRESPKTLLCMIYRAAGFQFAVQENNTSESVCLEDLDLLSCNLEFVMNNSKNKKNKYKS